VCLKIWEVEHEAGPSIFWSQFFFVNTEKIIGGITVYGNIEVVIVRSGSIAIFVIDCGRVNFQERTPCAASSIYFSERHLLPYLRGHIAVGGGQEARDDCQECQFWGIPTRLVEAEHVPSPRDVVGGPASELLSTTEDFQEVHGKYGVVHEYFEAWGPFFAHSLKEPTPSQYD
jgi:hypothetical protein